VVQYLFDVRLTFTARSGARSGSTASLNRQASNGARTANLSRSLSSQQQPSQSDSPVDHTRIKREASQTPWTPTGRAIDPFSQSYNLRDSTVNRSVQYTDSPFGSDASGFSGYPGIGEQYGTDTSGKRLGSSRKKTVIKRQDDSDDDDLPTVDDSEWEGRDVSAKLKGVIWPGMDIFDAATPEARRRRNQKKTHTVLEQLETNSQTVTNMETVWYPNGLVKKSKEISGFPNSSSPIQSPNPPDVRNAGLLLGDFTRRGHYTDSPSISRIIPNTRGVDPSGDRRIKRDFDAYHDGDDSASPASYVQPMNISYMTRGVATQYDGDDVDARPARRRMRDEGRMDNRAYENMSPASFNNQRVSTIGKYLQDHDQNSMTPKSHTNSMKDAAEKLIGTPNAQPGINHGRTGSGGSGISAFGRSNGRPDSGNIGQIRSAQDQYLLRGIGAQFTDAYANPIMFSGVGQDSMAYRSHGGNGHRSVGSITLDELMNNNVPSHMYMPNGGFGDMLGQNFAYSPQPANNSSMAMGANAGSSTWHPTYDWIGNGAIQQMMPNNHVFGSEENSNTQTLGDSQRRVVNYQNGAVGSSIEHATGYQNKSAGDIENLANQTGLHDGKQCAEAYVEKTNTNVASTPAAATEDEGRTITAPGSSPAA
jgi:hypothetical protein